MVKIFDYLNDDSTVFEKEPLRNLAKNNELMAFKHDGFLVMYGYTKRQIFSLEEIWSKGNAPWKVW
ncbi:hypothetical protein OFR39_14265 [Brachyspira hyodysenteriae]|uniref:hypothetical protein n=1 Tax=Brachyspira hyodysenteriae TaxID=159 RepID=UPI0022CE2421|nr:hypothetical protein [Brachyspira hyodysenteriae]MDA0027774.1 hypothetical protein [Brachyspira hyodysenteriae]